jgi:hypothetical protein
MFVMDKELLARQRSSLNRVHGTPMVQQDCNDYDYEDEDEDEDDRGAEEEDEVVVVYSEDELVSSRPEVPPAASSLEKSIWARRKGVNAAGDPRIQASLQRQFQLMSMEERSALFCEDDEGAGGEAGDDGHGHEEEDEEVEVVPIEGPTGSEPPRTKPVEIQRRMGLMEVGAAVSSSLDTLLGSTPSSSVSAPKGFPLPVIKEGYLLKQGAGISREWQRRYFCLSPSMLLYFASEEECRRARAKDRAPRKAYSLLSASVKQMVGPDGVGTGMGARYRPDRLLLTTPGRALVIEAKDVGEAIDWVACIQNCITATLRQEAGAGEPRSEDAAEALAAVPGNGRCADCRGAAPEWASTTFGVLLCIDCAGVHRSLGSHVSRVRSLLYDEWGPELRAMMRLLGNRRVNAWLEPRLSAADRHALDRAALIRAKYIDRAYAEAPEPVPKEGCGPDALQAPDRLLLEAVRTPDLARSAELLFRHRASPNTVQRLNGMNAVQVAASAGQTLQALLLIQSGGSLSHRDERGRSAAEIAMRSGFPALATLLAGIRT